MEIEFDPGKRERTLMARGVDFARAAEVFAGRHFTAEDDREGYGEARFITVGTTGRADGGHGLDTAWRGASHHQHEKGQ